MASLYGDAHKLIAVIGDEDTVTGFLLAGIGCTMDEQKNFMVVDPKTKRSDIETCFTSFMERSDIGLLLINQHVADDIRPVIAAATAPTDSGPAPVTVLEIPSKDAPYDPSRDPIMARVAQLVGKPLDGGQASS